MSQRELENAKLYIEELKMDIEALRAELIDAKSKIKELEKRK